MAIQRLPASPGTRILPCNKKPKHCAFINNNGKSKTPLAQDKRKRKAAAHTKGLRLKGGAVLKIPDQNITEDTLEVIVNSQNDMLFLLQVVKIASKEAVLKTNETPWRKSTTPRTQVRRLKRNTTNRTMAMMTTKKHCQRQ